MAMFFSFYIEKKVGEEVDRSVQIISAKADVIIKGKDGS